MPQMAPIKWLSMFIIFSMIFMFFMMITFYSYTPNKPTMKNLTKMNNSMNWKW